MVSRLVVSTTPDYLQTRNGGRVVQVSFTLYVPLRLADDEGLLPFPIKIMADKACSGLVGIGVVDKDATKGGREKGPPLLQSSGMSGRQGGGEGPQADDRIEAAASERGDGREVRDVAKDILDGFGRQTSLQDVPASLSNRGRGDKERKRGRRGRRAAGAMGDAGPARELDSKLSENIKGCDVSAQTKRKARNIERINGETCWIIKRGDHSKGEKRKSKNRKRKTD